MPQTPEGTTLQPVRSLLGEATRTSPFLQSKEFDKTQSLPNIFSRKGICLTGLKNLMMILLNHSVILPFETISLLSLDKVALSRILSS